MGFGEKQIQDNVMPFILKIDRRAIIDIQNSIDYYTSKQKGLGKKYLLEVKKYFAVLSEQPFYQVRYSNVRCLPLKKFPFMIHYVVSEEKNEIIVYAVIHTSLSPIEYPQK